MCSIVGEKVAACNSPQNRAAEIILRPPGQKGETIPLQAKRTEKLQVLRINFGKLLLVYFIRALGL